MINLKEIAERMNNSDELIQFYDRYKDEILDFSIEIINKFENEINIENEIDWIIDELNLYGSIMEDTFRYIIIPKIKDFPIMKRFAKEIKNNELLGIINGKKSYANFKKYINHNSLDKAWYDFRDNAYIEILTDWAIKNELLTKNLTNEEKMELFTLANSICDLAPWNYFTDMDYFTIKYDNQLFTYCILGNSDKCYGISIYIDEVEHNNHLIERLLATLNDQSLLPGFIKTCYNVYYDEYEDLDELNRDFIDDLVDEIKPKLYPNFIVCKTGLMPDKIKTELDYSSYMVGLGLLYEFLIKYVNKPRIYKDEFHLEITYVNDEFKIRKSNKSTDPSLDYLPYIDTKKLVDFLSSDFTITDDEYYFDLNALPFPQKEGDYNLCIYTPIIVDYTSENILYVGQVTAKGGEFFNEVLVDLINHFKNKIIPKKIYVFNPITALIIEILFRGKVIVEPNDNTYVVNNFFDSMFDDIMKEEINES